MQSESKAQHHEALAREIDGRVFFAGEHTCRTHPAQVVGALLSGVHAAGKIEAHARHDGHSLPPMHFEPTILGKQQSSPLKRWGTI